MMKLILDSIEVPFDGMYEHITTGMLNANKVIYAGEEMPDISGLIGKQSVTTLECKDEQGNEIELLGNYNKIEDFIVRYGEGDRAYDLALGYEE